MGAMKPYSVDLHERLLLAIDAGLGATEAARLFGVGASTISRWQQQRRETGDLRPRPRPGRTPSIGPDQAAAMRAQVAAHPDVRLADHGEPWADAHDVRVSVATMSRVQRGFGITVNKNGVGQ